MQQVNLLPQVARIEGLSFKRAQDAEKASCILQYLGVDGKKYEANIPILDVLYMLNCLITIEHDNGLRQRNRQDRDLIKGRVTKVGYSNYPNVPPLEQEVALIVADPSQQSPWEVRIGMVDAVFIHDEVRRLAKNLNLKISV